MRHAGKILMVMVAALVITGAIFASVERRAPDGAPPDGHIAAPMIETETTADLPAPSGSVDEEDEAVPVPLDELEIPVLVYHHVEPVYAGAPRSRPYEVRTSEFEAQLAFLREAGYESIDVDRLPAIFDGTAPPPEKPIIISFDDGRAGQYRYAFPLLTEYGFTAIFYVFTNAIGREGYLTWDQLLEMEDAGMRVGSHTRYHPYLTRSPDDELHEELIVSRDALESGLGHAVTSLAYPFGLYDDRVVDAARSAGYLTARTIDHGTMQRRGDLLRLRGHIMPGDPSYLRRILGE